MKLELTSTKQYVFASMLLLFIFSNQYQLGNTPSTITSTANKEQRVAQAVGGGDDDLQARLDSLRR